MPLKEKLTKNNFRNRQKSKSNTGNSEEKKHKDPLGPSSLPQVTSVPSSFPRAELERRKGDKSLWSQGKCIKCQ